MALHRKRSTEEYSTPQGFFDSLNDEFHFTIDACATKENAKCEQYFDKNHDGLNRHWDGIVWMNPPFKDCDLWVRKAWEESREGTTVVCLVPSRTDTAWWHEYAIRAKIRWIRGRLKFDSKINAPFSCCLLIFRPKKARKR